MGVFDAFSGCRGVGGFNGRCSGASIGDGGFTLVCISSCRGVVGFSGCRSGVSSGDGGFMLACISGCSGGGGCIVATWLRPVREIVRPANEKWPTIGVLWRIGRVFRGYAAGSPVLGEYFRGPTAAGIPLGEFFVETPLKETPPQELCRANPRRRRPPTSRAPAPRERGRPTTASCRRRTPTPRRRPTRSG